MSPFENMFKSSLQTADATAMSLVANSSATCARIMIDRIHVPPCTKTIPLSCRRKPSRPPMALGRYVIQDFVLNEGDSLTHSLTQFLHFVKIQHIWQYHIWWDSFNILFHTWIHRTTHFFSFLFLLHLFFSSILLLCYILLLYIASAYATPTLLHFDNCYRGSSSLNLSRH